MRGEKPRKVFYIDVQKLSRKEVNEIVKKLLSSMKKKHEPEALDSFPLNGEEEIEPGLWGRFKT